MGRAKGTTTQANGKNKSNGKSRGRKSKAEGMTGAKENAVEVRKAGELELGEPVVIDDGDFDLHLRSLKSAVERQKTAKNLYDGVCKAAKKVSPDLLTAIKRAVKFEGMDSEDIKRQLEIDGYVLRRAGSPVQITLHDTLLGDVTESATKRGYNDAKNGKVANSPFPENSDLSNAYLAGWQRGTAENLGMSSEDIAALDDDRPAGEGHNSHDEDGEFSGADEAGRRAALASVD